MSRLTQNERFAPTQPLPEHQERLRRQRRWSRPPYTPNHVPLGLRFIYGLMSLTWLGWALIGLLSGHMFFLVSRAGPLHFTGIPALMFSGAVLASAAACSVAVVDHYDRRDNEAIYKRLRWLLWLSAGAFFVLACIVGFAERSDILPYTDGSVGLLTAASVKSLLLSKWLAAKLGAYKAVLDAGVMVTMVWCFAGFMVMSKLGLLKRDEQPRPGALFFTTAFLIVPALSTFTLSLIYSLAAGDLPSRREMSEEDIRSQFAWMQSMLVACLAVLGLCFLGLVAIVLRWLGLIPPRNAESNNAI